MKSIVFPVVLATALLLGENIMMAAEITVIPTPQEVIRTDEPCKIAPGTQVRVEVPEQVNDLGTGIQMLTEVLEKEYGAMLNPQPGKSAKLTISLSLDRENQQAAQRFGRSFTPEMQTEGYFLETGTNTIIIMAQTSHGLFNGLMTLRQMLRGAVNQELPGVLIADYPAMGWRGISDDISRGQVSTMEDFKTIIRFLAEYKYNIYMPYLEDMIVLEKYPTIGQGRGALTKAEIAELQAYAKDYFIEIIPAFQTLGHFENILNLPEFVKYAEYPGAASLNVSSSEADEFLFGLLDEVVPLFDSPYFNIGADESWDVALGANRDLAAKEGVAAVHAGHYNKVFQKVKALGKKPMMYSDMLLRHPEALSRIPKDIIIVDWHYNLTDNYPSVKQLTDSGFTVIVFPAVHNWHNPFPNLANSWINITNLNREGYRNQARGTIVSNWGDFGAPNFRAMNFQGYSYAAESAWNPFGANEATIDARFFQQRYGLDDPRLAALMLNLNEIVNNTTFKEIWRQPFYQSEETSGKILFRSQQLIRHCRSAQSLIAELQPKVKRNVGDFAYYALAADLGMFTGKKLALAREIDLINRAGISSIAPKTGADVGRECSDLIQQLTVLEDRYKSLWLQTNRPDNLCRIVNLFRNLRAYLEEAREYIASDNYNIPAELSARFVTAKPVIRDEKPAPAFLRKGFRIENPDSLAGANLQMIANSEASIYLNGEKIGSLIATRSLSLVVENQRVGWWDVRDKIQAGQNYLAVTVQGYKAQLPSAANVYLELVYTNGRKVIVQSDADWEAATQAGDGWQTGKDKNVKWGPAIIADKLTWKISAPLFKKGFSSRIEF
jgi:hypothetical protein